MAQKLLADKSWKKKWRPDEYEDVLNILNVLESDGEDEEMEGDEASAFQWPSFEDDEMPEFGFALDEEMPGLDEAQNAAPLDPQAGPSRSRVATKRKARCSSPVPASSAEDHPEKKKRAKPGQSAPPKRKWQFRELDFEPMDIPWTTSPPTDLYADMTPYQIFKTLFNDELIELIVCETKKYALQKDGVEFDTDADEIERFLGILLLTGIVRMPTMRMYWGNDTRYSMVADVMSRNKFFSLLKYVHFADNSMMKKPGEEGFDKLYKVRPLLTHLQENLGKIEQEEMNSVDEQIIPFKGRSSIKQYVKAKPHKWGFKVFTRASASGIMYQFEVYVGASTCKDYGIGFSGNIVLHLTENIPLHKNYKVFTDNFFSSLHLAIALKERGNFMVGTVRSDRMGGVKLSSEAELKKKGRGSESHMTESKHGINLIRWFDRKSINFLSTYTSVQPMGTCERWNQAEKKKVPIPRPDVVKQYNSFMGGVDLADMLIEIYRIDRKSYKWYYRIVYWCLGVSMVNSWLLQRRFQSSKGSLLQFQMDVIKGLLMAKKAAPGSSGKRGRPPSTTNVSPPARRQIHPGKDSRWDCMDHFPEFGPKKRCKALDPSKLPCKGVTKVYCKKCSINLCFTPQKNCFVAYHKK